MSDPAPNEDFHIRLATWAADSAALLAVRTGVFVREQGIPMHVEVDGLDPACAHAIATIGDKPVGAGRISEAGHIGRVAVLADHRGRGIGSALIRCLIEQATDGAKVDLNAQVRAQRFYQVLGFVPMGERFMEEGTGIEHVLMVWKAPRARKPPSCSPEELRE